MRRNAETPSEDCRLTEFDSPQLIAAPESSSRPGRILPPPPRRPFSRQQRSRAPSEITCQIMSFQLAEMYRVTTIGVTIGSDQNGGIYINGVSRVNSHNMAQIVTLIATQADESVTFKSADTISYTGCTNRQCCGSGGGCDCHHWCHVPGW